MIAIDYIRRMSSGNLRKFALGVLLIWAFFGCYVFAESIGAIYNAQENVTKTCESALSYIQGVRTDNGRTQVWFQPLCVIPVQNAFSSIESKILNSFIGHNELPAHMHPLYSALHL